jgi:hypothetical protein
MDLKIAHFKRTVEDETPGRATWRGDGKEDG